MPRSPSRKRQDLAPTHFHQTAPQWWCQDGVAYSQQNRSYVSRGTPYKLVPANPERFLRTSTRAIDENIRARVVVTSECEGWKSKSGDAGKAWTWEGKCECW